VVQIAGINVKVIGAIPAYHVAINVFAVS